MVNEMTCNNCHTELKEFQTQCSDCGSLLHNDCAFLCISCAEALCDKCALSQKYTCKKCGTAKEFNMDFISSTMFEEYNKCSYLFKQRYINKTIDESLCQNRYSVVGNILHSLFDEYSKIRPLDVSQQRSIMYKYNFMINDARKYFDTDEQFETVKKDTRKTIINWLVKERDCSEPLFTEEQMFLELTPELPKIRCTIDRINGYRRIDNSISELYVVDYKTGKIYDANKLRNTLQLPLYALAIRKTYGTWPTTLQFVFPAYTRSDGEVQTRTFALQRMGSISRDNEPVKIVIDRPSVQYTYNYDAGPYNVPQPTARLNDLSEVVNTLRGVNLPLVPVEPPINNWGINVPIEAVEVNKPEIKPLDPLDEYAVYQCTVRGGGTYTFNTRDKLLECIEIYKKIQNDVFPAETGNNIFCTQFCPLGKNDMCMASKSTWASVKKRYNG